MNVIVPDVTKPETFSESPENISNVCFIFVPTDKQLEEVVFLMSIVFLKDKSTIRIEPRYFSPEIFDEFLKNTGLERFYNLFFRAIGLAETPDDVIKQIQYLQEQKVIACEIMKPSDFANPAYYNDYSKCKLFNKEPKTLIEVDDKVIEQYINKLSEILPSDYEVENV
jgi:hypothetical protein